MAAVLEWRYTGGWDNSNPDYSKGGAMSQYIPPDFSYYGDAQYNLSPSVSFAQLDNGYIHHYRAMDIYNSGDAEAAHVCIYSSYTVVTGFDEGRREIKIAEVTHDGSDQNDYLNDGTSWTDPPYTCSIWQDGYDATQLRPNYYSVNIPAGQAIRVWIHRIIDSTTNYDYREFPINVGWVSI